MNHFGDFFAPPYALSLTKRERVETWYRNARYFIMASLLLTCLFTILSLIRPHPFLLTLTVPHTLIVWGYLSSGRAPADVYASYAETGFTASVKGDATLILAVVAALLVLSLFAVCWYRSKDHHAGWIIAALVLMLVDTAAMIVIYGFPAFGVVFHGGVIIILIIGIRAHFRLKKMPPDHPEIISFDELK